MYAVEVSSKAFSGSSLVKQHRMVMDAIQEEIKGMHGGNCLSNINIHALSPFILF